MLKTILCNRQHSVVMIQSYWRSYRIRKKVQVFCKLPHEIWNLVLEELRRPHIFLYLDNVLRLRLIRLRFGPPSSYIKEKLHTLKLLRKYKRYIKQDTLQMGFILCVSCSKTIRNAPTCHFLLNAFIEDCYCNLL